MITTEAVSKGHPDKFCDQVSDKITTYILKQTAGLPFHLQGKSAVEVLAKNDTIVIAGEYWLPDNKTIKEDVLRQLVNEVVLDVGYTNLNYKLINLLDYQSKEINQAVANNSNIKAGDQGIMYGYACDEKGFLPTNYFWCQELMKQYAEFVKTNNNYRPDAKCQITTRSNNSIHQILLSAQHIEGLTERIIERELKDFIYSVLPQHFHKNIYNIIINPSKSFVKGGFEADCGLTGRKIINDTYGGLGRHGGGAFSGKDYTKVDRSGAYIARYYAKNIVASGIAKKCEIQLSYAIGKAEPFSVQVDTFNTTSKKVQNKLQEMLYDLKLTPNFIFKELKLYEVNNLEQIYLSSKHGHFTNNDFTWEQFKKITI